MAVRPLSSALALTALLVAGPVDAQTPGPLRYRVDESTGALEMQIGALFDEELRDALDEGFPIRIQLRATLWRAGFFDARVAEYDWRASARQDGTGPRYRLEVAVDDESRSVEGFGALDDALRRELGVPLRPKEPGRYYYQVALEVVSLSVSDLEELERWLQGDTETDDEAEDRGALSRGVQRLFVRALGLPSRRLQRRTRSFDWPR
jgi:hypothetical protein